MGDSNGLGLMSAIQAGAGLLQAGIGAIGARKRQRELMKQVDNMPKYSQNEGILDYYNKAIKRYNTSPTDTAMYKTQLNDINSNAATAVGSLQDRRSGLMGVSSILRGTNKAKLDANVAAEQEQNQRFGALGSATEMKAGEDREAWKRNSLDPFELKTNLLMQKTAAANQMVNTGLTNAFGGLQTYVNKKMMS